MRVDETALNHGVYKYTRAIGRDAAADTFRSLLSLFPAMYSASIHEVCQRMIISVVWRRLTSDWQPSPRYNGAMNDGAGGCGPCGTSY